MAAILLRRGWFKHCPIFCYTSFLYMPSSSTWCILRGVKSLTHYDISIMTSQVSVRRAPVRRKHSWCSAPGQSCQPHHNGVTWAPWPVKSPAIRLFDRLFVWQLDFFFYYLCFFGLTTKKIQKLCIVGPFWGESRDRWIHLTKGL